MKIKLSKINVTNQSILLFLSGLLMIRPYYIQLNMVLNTIWAYLTVVMAIVTTIIVVKKRNSREVWLWIMSFCVIRIFSSVINGYSDILSEVSVFAQILLAFNIGLLFLSDTYGKIAGTILNYVISIYLYLDIISGILGISKRLGLGTEYSFIGYDNYAVYIILPLLCVKWAIRFKKNQKLTKNDWICWAACLAMKVYTLSYNAILMLLIYAILYLLASKMKQIRRFINPRNAAIIAALMLIGVIRFNVHHIFSGVLLQLGKGTTLNSRTSIWPGVISAIWRKPILGYGGMRLDGIFQELIGLNKYWTQATHAHNLYLQLLFEVGIIGFVIYFLMVRHCLKYFSLIKTSRLFAILAAGIGTYFLMLFFDGYIGTTSIYLLYAVFYSFSIREFSEKRVAKE